MTDTTTLLLIFVGVLNFLCLIALFQIKNELDSGREIIDTRLKCIDAQYQAVLLELAMVQKMVVVTLSGELAEAQTTIANDIERVHNDVSRLAITLDTQLKDIADIAAAPSTRFADNNFKVPVQRINPDGTTTVELRDPMPRRTPIKDEKVVEDLYVKLWGRQ